MQLVGYFMFLQLEEHIYLWMLSLMNHSHYLSFYQIFHINGAIRLRDVTTQIPNQDVLVEYTSDPTSKAEIFPQDLDLPHPTVRSMGDQSGYFILGIHLEGTGLVGRFRVL